MTFPFSAIVGMDDMRLALILNAIAPSIGGVLVRGEKGTAKSTAVRALPEVLPPVAVVDGCRFSCDPAAPDPACPDGPHPPGAPATTRAARLVELPVGSSDDRLTGSLDLEAALTRGVTAFRPGLLAGAHRGILYVDEVNLLHDHLVDLLLDAAALGTNYVERDGVSVRHAARFLLVGTMNPEEGELRPQLLDRFGLTVEVAAPSDAPLRAEVVRRRLAFDADPAGFASRWAADEAALAADIAAARAALAAVAVPDAKLRQIAVVCAGFEVDGLRADIVMARVAAAHAAWRGRAAATTDDVRVAARLALPHRRRRNPFDTPGLDEDLLERLLADGDPQDDPEPPEPDGEPADPDGDSAGADGDAQRADGGEAPDRAPEDDSAGSAAPQQPSGSRPDEPPAQPQARSGDAPAQDDAQDPQEVPVRPATLSVAAAGAAYRVRRIEAPGIGAGAPGRRSRAETGAGRAVGSRRPDGAARSIHLVATVSAAAPHQRARGRRAPGLILQPGDLREARREGRESNLVLFAVDASGSMAARQRMSAVKAAVLSLLLDAYQRRDKVGVVSFRGDGAQLLLPPTSSVEAAAARMESLPTGGRTPLQAGLLEAGAVLARERLRDPRRRALLVIVTDGRHTRGGDPLPAAQLLRRTGAACIVVDCESGPVRLGRAPLLAVAAGGQCLRLEELAAGGLAGMVRDAREAA